MKTLKFLIDLPFRFIFAFLRFTFFGWIGWCGLVLIALKLFGVIDWPWWAAALPLEYGALYCLYMTIDGALYRAGKKGIGGYARFTSSDEQLAQVEIEQAVRDLGELKKTPEEKERMMDSLKIARLEICTRVYDNLPEQLRNSDEIARAIAEQVNYATASSQYEGNDKEMRRKLNALFDKLRRNGADEAANEIAKAVGMRPHYLDLAENIMR